MYCACCLCAFVCFSFFFSSFFFVSEVWTRLHMCLARQCEGVYSCFRVFFSLSSRTFKLRVVPTANWTTNAMPRSMFALCVYIYVSIKANVLAHRNSYVRARLLVRIYSYILTLPKTAYTFYTLDIVLKIVLPLSKFDSILPFMPSLKMAAMRIRDKINISFLENSVCVYRKCGRRHHFLSAGSAAALHLPCLVWCGCRRLEQTDADAFMWHFFNNKNLERKIRIECKCKMPSAKWPTRRTRRMMTVVAATAAMCLITQFWCAARFAWAIYLNGKYRNISTNGISFCFFLDFSSAYNWCKTQQQQQQWKIELAVLRGT